MSIFLVLLVFAIVWQVSSSQRFQEIGGKYYYIEHYDKLDWYDAREECRSMNAHLVSIQNYREWVDITDHLRSCKSYWVDIIDEDSDYNFISDTTGREAPYLKWSSGQPRHRSSYDCVKLRSVSHKMKTKYCSQENHYICEKNTNPATSSQIVRHPGTIMYPATSPQIVRHPGAIIYPATSSQIVRHPGAIMYPATSPQIVRHPGAKYDIVDLNNRN